jgi:hypothetical protein
VKERDFTIMGTRTMPRLFALCILALLPCTLFVGCGSGHPETFPVAGRITYGGQPVTQGTIMFYPEEGRSAMGTIAADGSYRLTTFTDGDGALPGRHTVTITAIAESGSAPASMEEEMQQGMLGKEEGGVRWLVPQRYSRRETSGLTADVPAEGGAIDFQLTD